MAAKNTKKRYTGILVAGLIVCAIVCHGLSKCDILQVPLSLVHTVICIGICIGWGISVSKRIVQSKVRNLMLGVSAMFVFWFVTRSIKYYFNVNPDIARYLWYSYYAPILFVPVFVVLIALSLGKSENYRLSKWGWLLLIPGLLFLVVLTNDLHQLTFVFPEGQVWSDDDYSYGITYYLIWIHELAGILAAFVIMRTKCRQARKKQYLPAILILLANLYSIMYVTMSGWHIFSLFLSDMIMVFSLLLISMLESAIQCGLIQTNTGYAELFEIGTLGTLIVDNAYHIHYTSSNAPKLTRDIMNAAQDGMITLDRNTVIKGQPIIGGHVYWQEDITDLTSMLDKMERNKTTIEQNNHIEEENLSVKRKIHALREKNLLYDLLQAKIAPQINMLNHLFSQYNGETDEKKCHSLLGKIAVVGAYIKRCGNLLFIGEKSENIDTVELSLCMKESFANLSLMGTECAMDIPQNYMIATKDAIRVYDVFEQITEAAIDNLHSVWLKARIFQEAIIFHLEVECKTSLEEFSLLVDSCNYEDGIWNFTLRIRKAGEES